ncbi:MAG: YkgJ family cysteine cluster protein [Oscillospiraceae bacterium]|nr:YkgJ family cysteine cluster protein [Oscillospiraceae bacterium]
MLTKLLRRSTCAACRQCCRFDRYDVWEMPLLSRETRALAQEVVPEAEYVSRGTDAWIFRVRALDADECFVCPLLDANTGCRLGSEKPFDCRIWPFCIMELDGRQVITIAPICEAMMALPMGTVLSFLKEELADTIFTYAAGHPDVVRPYDSLYPILLWKPQEF